MLLAAGSLAFEYFNWRYDMEDLMEDLNEEVQFSDASAVLREIVRRSEILDQNNVTTEDRQHVEHWISDPQTKGQAEAALDEIVHAEKLSGAQPQAVRFGHAFSFTKLIIIVIAGGVAIAAAAAGGAVIVAVPATVIALVVAFTDVVKDLTTDEKYVLIAVQELLKTKPSGVTRAEIVRDYEQNGKDVPVELDDLLSELVDKNALYRKGGVYTPWTYMCQKT
jgi:hypothetical protein